MKRDAKDPAHRGVLGGRHTAHEIHAVCAESPGAPTLCGKSADCACCSFRGKQVIQIWRSATLIFRPYVGHELESGRRKPRARSFAGFPAKAKVEPSRQRIQWSVRSSSLSLPRDECSRRLVLSARASALMSHSLLYAFIPYLAKVPCASLRGADHRHSDSTLRKQAFSARQY